jgi:hypothetical protein
MNEKLKEKKKSFKNQMRTFSINNRAIKSGNSTCQLSSKLPKAEAQAQAVWTLSDRTHGHGPRADEPD